MLIAVIFKAALLEKEKRLLMQFILGHVWYHSNCYYVFCIFISSRRNTELKRQKNKQTKNFLVLEMLSEQVKGLFLLLQVKNCCRTSMCFYCTYRKLCPSGCLVLHHLSQAVQSQQRVKHRSLILLLFFLFSLSSKMPWKLKLACWIWFLGQTSHFWDNSLQKCSVALMEEIEHHLVLQCCFIEMSAWIVSYHSPLSELHCISSAVALQ